jgi:integrase
MPAERKFAMAAVGKARIDKSTGARGLSSRSQRPTIERSRLVKSLSKQELLMLLAAAKAHRERDWLMILVCFWHGLRASDLVSFERDAIADGYLRIRARDGSDRIEHLLVEHPLPLLNEKDALIEFAQQAEYGVPIFNVCRRRVDQLMKRYCAQAGIPAHLAHAQTLRHTVARLSIESGGIEYARRWLGHKSRTSIYEYSKASENSNEEAGQEEFMSIGNQSPSTYDFPIFAS